MFLGERLRHTNSKKKKCASTEGEPGVYLIGRLGKMKTLITSGEAMENESADWATGQPVGAGVFFSLLEDNDLFLFSGILAVHTQQKKKKSFQVSASKIPGC